jgi:hypothetical protein
MGHDREAPLLEPAPPCVEQLGVIRTQAEHLRPVEPGTAPQRRGRGLGVAGIGHQRGGLGQ